MPLLTPDPAHPGLLLITGPGLTPDPDHPGMLLITGPGLTEDPDHPGMLLIDAGEPGTPVDLDVDIPHGQSLVTVHMTVRTDLKLDVVRGHTRARIQADHQLRPDTVRGHTAVSASMPQPHLVHDLVLSLVLAYTDVRVVRLPDLSRNTPILLGLSLGARLEALEPLVSV